MSSYKKLTEIGLKYNTDKAYFHLFTEFYNDFFEKFLDKEINILEIGIFQGSSLKMLREYFPKANIYAIDIDEIIVNKNYGSNIITHLCSQIDLPKLKSIIKDVKFDIIIDDGSHITSHQQKSLGFLFSYLNPAGIYICEDLHTSYNSSYVDSKITTLEILEKYNKTKTFESDLINECENKYLTDNITEVSIYYRNKNALKCYGCGKYNTNCQNICDCGINLSPSDKSITSVILHK